MTMEKRKVSKEKRRGMNRAVVGIDLGDSESLATLLYPLEKIAVDFTEGEPLKLS